MRTTTRMISIDRWDGSRWVWCGSGIVARGLIQDCAAVLGDHSDDVYGCIEYQLTELRAGEVIDPDGVRYSWEMSES